MSINIYRHTFRLRMFLLKILLILKIQVIRWIIKGPALFSPRVNDFAKVNAFKRIKVIQTQSSLPLVKLIEYG